MKDHIIKPRKPYCADCGVEKTEDNTYLIKRQIPGRLYFHTYCMDCSNVRSTGWAKANPEQHSKIVSASLKRNYDPVVESQRNRDKYLKRKNK